MYACDNEYTTFDGWINRVGATNWVHGIETFLTVPTATS